MNPLPLDEIICGDNCDVLGGLPRACIDLVVTSPPYDDLRTYGGHSWDFYGVAWQLKRVLKPGGVIVWVVGDSVHEGGETLNGMRQVLHFQSLGLTVHDTMIYWKDAFPFPDKTRYAQVWESMFVLASGKPSSANIRRVPTQAHNRVKSLSYQRNADGTTTPMKYEMGKADRPQENVWIYDVGYMKTTKEIACFEHPAMFPEALARDHILSWSNEGDIVLDPFNGSGTTSKMARELGRHFIGIEINADYCEIARKRLQQQLLPFEASDRKAGGGR